MEADPDFGMDWVNNLDIGKVYVIAAKVVKSRRLCSPDRLSLNCRLGSD